MNTRELPYERQRNPSSCGAAALCMAYRSLGIECNQDEVWAAVAGASLNGKACSRAQALAADALRRGLSALAIQIRDPWIMLNQCVNHSVMAIINHAPQPKSSAGHFSVLVSVDDQTVVMHDPNAGPNRASSRAEFLQLWNPQAQFSEILGQVLIAVSNVTFQLEKCPLCTGQAQDTATCKSCRRQVQIQPLAILGCLTDWCPMRAWEQVFCPWCDSSWTKGLSS